MGTFSNLCFVELAGGSRRRGHPSCRKGQTMSAPARAWDRACSARIARVGVVRHIAVFDDAAVAVVGVLAKADIGDDQEIEFGFANGFDGALDDALARAVELLGHADLLFPADRRGSRPEGRDLLLRDILRRSDRRIADGCRAWS